MAGLSLRNIFLVTFLCSFERLVCAENSGNCTGYECNAGKCHVMQNYTVCLCGAYTSGPHCELVNLHIPIKTWMVDGISFEWSHNITLENYIAVIYERHSREKTLQIMNMTLTLDRKRLEVRGLKLGGVSYILCVVHPVRNRLCNFMK